MKKTIQFALMILCGMSTISLHTLEISGHEAGEIAQKIWMNECNQTLEGLISWNKGEEFASLGVGHFIWYPLGKKGNFTETFPALVQFLHNNKATLPSWLTPKTACPWHTREEFEKNRRSSKIRELHALLGRTISLQALFMADRFNTVEPSLTKNLTTNDSNHVKAQIKRLSAVAGGNYVLLDYLNFKGDGTSDNERYQGKGWGLLQVLLQMPGNTQDPIEEFVACATKILTDRVELSPPQRNEARWLQGWLNRVKTYTIYQK